MFGKCRVVQPEAFKKVLFEIGCGKARALASDAFEMVQTETKPVDDLVLAEDSPKCCSYHRSLYSIGKEALEKFPDCCEGHRKLKTATWFTKSNYNYLRDKLVRTAAYTLNCIEGNIEKDDWYKRINDYIAYTIGSYGQMPD